MRVLALTHAHLNSEGLSPVSCERADSMVGVWAQELKWDIDIIHTAGTKWRGIWPEGKGLKANIITPAAPHSLMMSAPELFSVTLKKLLAQKNITGIGSAISRRIAKRLRGKLAANGLAHPHEMKVAAEWGNIIGSLPQIKGNKYDLIFVCIGFGDEYLLQTALTLSLRLKAPMVVDFRDLWSDHHDPDRFTNKQRQLIRRHEARLLRNAILVSAPQKPMAEHLRTQLKMPVHLASHSAYVEPGWPDGKVVGNEFRMLYSGKLYAGNPGLQMMIDTLKKLSGEQLPKPVKCYFFTDEVGTLQKMVKAAGVEHMAVISGWITPGELWQEIRSAHVLIVFDSGVEHGMPLIMTKVFNYAYSGRQVLALSPYGNSNYEDFFNTYDCGVVCTNAGDAANWVKNVAAGVQQYQLMPNFRKILSRTDVAIDMGKHIQSILQGK